MSTIVAGRPVPLSTATHVRRFLNITDLDGQALDLLSAALRSTTKNRAGWPTLQRLEQWTTAQLERLGVDPDDALGNDDVLDVMASVHLVTSRVPAQFRRPSASRFQHGVAALLDLLEPDFIPELLKETRRRKEADPIFAADLAQSRRAVVNLARRASALRAKMIESLPAEIADDPDRPVTLREEQEGEIALAVFVIVLVVTVVISWIAYNDPSKDPESEEDEDEE